MPEHLTQRTLARLDPEGTGKRYFVYGSNPVGLGIEVSAKGKARYFIAEAIIATNLAQRRWQRNMGSYSNTSHRISRITLVCTASYVMAIKRKFFRRVSHAENFHHCNAGICFGRRCSVFLNLNHNAKSNTYATNHAMHHGTSGADSKATMQG